MVNIINHKANANQNPNEMPLHIMAKQRHRMAGIKKADIINVGKDVEKLETSYTACGNIKWYSCVGK